ncbi:MAG TPA: hypothetical protein VFE21_07550, partial [Rubrobacteraceae bacterium]|nr:hypothetical protein [Rubrobacteraceae bacterium]
RIATSTGSGVTGERAGVILLDDPVDLRSAFYPDEITRAVDHFRTALRSRGSGDATRYVAIMQRLVYGDFAAALLDEADRGGRLEYLLDDPNGARGYSQHECGVFVTVDLASSLSEGADRTCYAAWAATPDGDLLLLDLRWGKIPGERQLPELRDFCRRWRPWKVLIEAVGYQQAFVAQAAAAGLPGVEPIRRGPHQHKELRASALAQLMSEGRFFVPALVSRKIPPWREDYLAELLSFPTGRHDDVVDVSADAAR